MNIELECEQLLNQQNRMNIKKEFDYIDNHFDNIDHKTLVNQLVDCGLKIDEEILDNGLSRKEVELLKQLLEEEIKMLDKTKSLSRKASLRINDFTIRVIVENDKWI